MSSSVNRIVNYHINRLKDKRPEVRLEAIRELELLADPAALEPLKIVFENDSNTEVKKAAQSAGRSIFLKNQTASSD
ncbi:MAG: hypothetical protein Kow00117_12390 [Phototrophicales bacterium]|nr:MAG: HEAT repeat domain-containing protein [Chloroflexota bacterium]